MWPDALQSLAFGCTFNQRIQGVDWPASLKRLVLEHNFNLPIARAK